MGVQVFTLRFSNEASEGLLQASLTPQTQIPHKEETPAALLGGAPRTEEDTLNYYLPLFLLHGM